MNYTVGSAPYRGQTCARIAGRQIEFESSAWGNYNLAIALIIGILINIPVLASGSIRKKEHKRGACVPLYQTAKTISPSC
jgi:hypothetical protein